MVDGKKLKKIVIQILKKRGLSLSHATISAKALINAEYVGAYGHGVSRLKMYCERIKKKVINPKPKLRLKKYLTRYLLLMLTIQLDLLQQIQLLRL